MGSIIDYHLLELRGALVAPEDGRNRPMLRPTDVDVLDVGCGIGQSFTAWRMRGLHVGRHFVGLDIDAEAIEHAKRHSPEVAFAEGRAEALPLLSESFDLVFSRVSLPYTDVPVALREMVRVLRPRGRIWLTLHPKDRPGRMLADARGVRAKAYRCIEWLNGHCLRLFGFVVPVAGRYISWQDPDTICEMLRALGVGTSVTVYPDGHYVLQGRKRWAGDPPW